MMAYDDQLEEVNGLLNEDGTVTTYSGEVVDLSAATEEYKRRLPRVNKFLNPDGSVSTFGDVSGVNFKLDTGYTDGGLLLGVTSIASTEVVYLAGDGVHYKLITGTTVPYAHDGTDTPNMTYFEEVSYKTTSDKLENLYLHEGTIVSGASDKVIYTNGDFVIGSFKYNSTSGLTSGQVLAVLDAPAVSQQAIGVFPDGEGARLTIDTNGNVNVVDAKSNTGFLTVTFAYKL